MKQLFISYSRVDKDDVDDLARRLPGLGYQVWLDSSLHGGQTWWDEILRRIAESDAVIAAISRASLNSVACRREVEWALALGKPLLPVAVEPVTEALPTAISTRQIVDYSNPGQDAAYALVGALNSLPAAPPPPEVLPNPPEIPLSYLSDLVDRVAKPALTHDEQRQIVTEIQPALRSADAEERQGAHFILDQFVRRNDLYADIYQMVDDLKGRETQTAATSVASTPRMTPQSVPDQWRYGPNNYANPPQPTVGFPGPPAPTHVQRPLRQRSGTVVALIAAGLVALVTLGVAWFLFLRPTTVEPAGTIIGDPIAVGKKPYDIEQGNGLLWTANSGEDTISKIDPDSGTAKEIRVGGTPVGLTTSGDIVWVWNYTTELTPVNMRTEEVYDPVSAGGVDIIAVTAGGGYIWVAHKDNTVTRISEKTGEIIGDPIPVGKDPYGMKFSNDLLFVVNTGDRTITAIDTEGTVRGNPIPVENAVGAIDAVGGTLYVGTEDSVTPIDETSFAIGKPISLEGGGYFTPDGNGMWVSFPVVNEVRYFDHTGAESKGGPIRGVGKGISDMQLIDHTLWLVDQDNNSVLRARIR